MTLWPLTFEILVTFALAAWLLYRYGNWANQNVITTVSVFVAWFFSFIVIFILPLDISTTSYNQCVMDFDNSMANKNLSLLSEPMTTAFPVITNGSIISDNSTTNFTTLVPAMPRIVADCHEPWSYAPGNVLPMLWRIVYWTGQCLTWIILPLMQSYSMAGDFTTLGKLKSAFIENAIYYGSFAVIFVLLLIYVAIRIPLSWAYLKVICITASNTWGLVLLIVLLGYGLVDIPRSCFNVSQHARNLSYYYFKVAKLSAEKCEAEEKLDDALEEIHHAYDSIITTHDPMKPYIDVILEKCPLEWRKQLIIRYQEPQDRSRGHRGGASVNEKSLIRMHQKIIKAVQAHHRTKVQWDVLIRNTVSWEDVARNEANPTRYYKSTFTQPSSSSKIVAVLTDNLYTPTVEWYWKCVIRGSFYRFLGYLLTCVTFMVVFSELTFSFQHPTLSILAILINSARDNHSYFFIEMFSILAIAYLSVCTFYTVFKIRIFNYYYLAPHHQTDEYSLIFCGMLLCRLTPPLCLNFLGLIHLDSHITKESHVKETAFTGIMGHMDVISIISDGFNIYLPIVMCLFCLATFLRFGARLLHMMGIEQYMVDDDMTTDLVKEGQELVKREKNKKLRQAEVGANRERWTATTNRVTSQVSVPVDSPPESGGPKGLRAQMSRVSSEENATIELLNDEEPIDYATTWSTSNSRPFDNKQPQRGIFDDI